MESATTQIFINYDDCLQLKSSHSDRRGCFNDERRNDRRRVNPWIKKKEKKKRKRKTLSEKLSNLLLLITGQLITAN